MTTKAKGWSIPQTTQVVLKLLTEGLGIGSDWSQLGARRVLDVGAGRGHFSKNLGDSLSAAGLEPKQHIFACDLIPSSFEYDAIECHASDAAGRLPFDDASFDAVISIEVIEHVEDQFAFLRELHRVAKPGAPVIVTTPNTHNLNSRVRSLTWGFPLLYNPLPHDMSDPRLLGGHIHPIAPYFLCYGALRAGLGEIELHGDRLKSSARALWLLLWPFLWIGRAKNRARLTKKQPQIAAENQAWIDSINGTTMLLARTAILFCRRPR